MAPSIVEVVSPRVVEEGASAPLGATVLPGGVNFSVFSKKATLIELLLFDDADAQTPGTAQLAARNCRSWRSW